MVKSKYEEVTTVTKRSIEDATYCDVCGKLIGVHKWNRESFPSTKDSQKYFWFCSTFHNEWGRDSVDSNECADICSAKCIKEWMNKYLDDPDDYATREFEIKHERF